MLHREEKHAATASPLVTRFVELAGIGSGALITYFPIGFGYDAVDLAETYLEGGVDVLEVGLPTADPYLDGPVVAEAMAQALATGYGVERCFAEIARIRSAFPAQPIEVFTYAEVVTALGVDRFLELCTGNGVDSVLIGGAPPDWLVKESSSFASDMDLLGLAPFNFSDELVREMREAPLSGYVFLQATPGLTGVRAHVEPELGARISKLREGLGSQIPICTGFGIANAEHCKEMRLAGADGVIVGSLALQWLAKAGPTELSRRLAALKEALSDQRS